MKKRALTLTGGILGTVVNSAMSAILLIGAFGMFAGSAITESGEVAAVGALLGAIMLIMAAFSITALVLNAVATTAWNGDAEKYAKRRPVIITAIVFNLLLFVYFIYNMAAAGSNVMAIVESVLFIICLGLASAFYIVDLCNEKKNVGTQVPPVQQ